MISANDFKGELESAIAGLPVNYSTKATEVVVLAGADEYPVEGAYVSESTHDGKTRIVIEIDPEKVR